MSFDSTGGRAPAQPTHDGSVTGAVSRLTAEFEGALQPPVVRRVVLGSRRDLAGAPVPALPELVERLARQRLLQSISAGRAHL
jgi:hypothetical protein